VRKVVFFSSSPVYLIFIAYFNRVKSPCGTIEACESMASPDWARVESNVKFDISEAKLTSIRLLYAAEVLVPSV
jgi:hypothetical protein